MAEDDPTQGFTRIGPLPPTGDTQGFVRRPRVTVTPSDKPLPADDNTLGFRRVAPGAPPTSAPPGQRSPELTDAELQQLERWDPEGIEAYYRSRRVQENVAKGISPHKPILPEIYHAFREGMSNVGAGFGKAFGHMPGGEGRPPTAGEGALGFGQAALGAIEMLPPVAIGTGLVHSFSQPASDISGLPEPLIRHLGELLVPGGPPGMRAIGRELSKSKTLQHLLPQATNATGARTAAALIRGRNALGVRQTESSYAQLNERPPVLKPLMWGQAGTAGRNFVATTLEQEVNKLPVLDQLNLIHHIETRSKGGLGATIAPRMRQFADIFRRAMQERRVRVASLPGKQRQQFIDDYYRHLWKDPNAAAAFAKSWGTKAGTSGGALKQRKFPTVQDGIAAGLVPETLNSVETMVKYMSMMDHYVGMVQALDTGKTLGQVKFFANARKVPDGWEALEGGAMVTKRVPTKNQVVTMQAYAPAGFARVWNNYVSKGAESSKVFGPWYNAMQLASNAVTQLELGLSGYHAITMGREAIISDVASGITKIVGGAPFSGFGTIARAPLAPVRSAMTGKKLQNAYLDKTLASPDYAHIADLLTGAGGRAVGRSHALDYRFSDRMGSYWGAFRKGVLRAQFAADKAEIKGAPFVGTAKVALRHIGRILQTVGAPLFEHYIPLLKNGAFYQNMSDWLKVHPNASLPEQMDAARAIVDSIDNRFGEMIQDNIFWHRLSKQAAMLAMRSYSWNMGTVREIGGGALDMTKARWSPRAAYALALPLYSATEAAITQYLLTGEAPKDELDLIAPRTGGITQGASVPSMRPFGRSTTATVPERLQMPGYGKDVFAWYDDWQKAVAGKVNTYARSGFELYQNQDWKNDPIFTPENSVPTWVKEFFAYTDQNFGPISVRQAIKGPEVGSNIPALAQTMGFRPAPKALEDPAGTREAQRRRHLQAEKLRAKHELKDRIRHGVYGQ